MGIQQNPLDPEDAKAATPFMCSQTLFLSYTMALFIPKIMLAQDYSDKDMQN